MDYRPTFDTTGIITMMSVVIANIYNVIKTIAVYHACAKLTGSPSSPVHAIKTGVQSNS